jgi:membrane protein
MMRIEKTFNMIWRVPVSRGFVNKLTMYWAVLTLGPLALGVATTLSVQPLFEWLGADVSSFAWLRTAGIFVLTWMAFCVTFLLVPNCKVPIPYAVLGSMVSTILFTLAKSLFLVYINQASYSVIYGALATIPIFLLWLYVVWGVILLGASLAASLTTFNDRRSDWQWPESWELLLVFRLLGHFYQAQGQGEALTTEELLALEPGVPSNRLRAILVRLVGEDLVAQDQEQCWVLKRDLDRYTLRDLYVAGEYHLPIGKDLPVPTKSVWDAAFMALLNHTDLNMDQSLASLYKARDAKG